MDVISKTEVVCYSISIATFESLLGENYRKVLLNKLIEDVLKKVPIFKEITLNCIEMISICIKTVDYSENQVAVSNSEEAEGFIYIPLVGNLIDSESNEILLKKGNVLYEGQFVNGMENKWQKLIAYPDCFLVEIDLRKIKQSFGVTFDSLISQFSFVSVLKDIKMFTNLSQSKLMEIGKLAKYRKFENNENIIKEGEEGHELFFVKSGKVDFYVNNSYLRSFNDNGYFGERALFFSEKRSATAISNGESELYTISKDKIQNLFDERQTKFFKERLILQDNTVELDDLIYHSQLGSGSYGDVFLVSSTKNSYNYAIKSISKPKVIKESLQENLDLEKKVLLQIDHPFIMKLVKTLKDESNIYFLLELIHGKELFDVIRDIGMLNHDETKFYAAMMMLAVDFLHSKNIVYRDIKPENVLIAPNGFMKLIDFGTVNIVHDRCSTIIGTPHYMAPEVILGEGYTFSVDFWSIGRGLSRRLHV